MKCKILHESAGRMRVRMQQRRMTAAQADRLHFYLAALPEVMKVTVSEHTMDATILFDRKKEGAREALIEALSAFDYEKPTVEVPEHTGRELNRIYEDKLFFLILGRAFRAFVLPNPVSRVYNLVKGAHYVMEGLHCLRQGRLEVPVLDATTIAVSLLRGDFQTAGSVMFLLDAGALLEEWTHKKSVDDLARRMYLNVDRAWVRTGEGEEILVSVRDVQPGDHVVVRTGNVIPLDGVVEAGEGSVNQASMTGESLPVRKDAGAYVYAGTVLEEGELEFRVEKALGSGRYDKIVTMIEDSEKLKSATESRAAHLADSLVPWSLGGTALVWLLTRNATRALSFLMVDFSCALKLAMPITVLSAMRECSDHHINVKGGKFLEAVAGADTIVFDKTGTLTRATPGVRRVVTFGGRDEAEMLRLAACLEEHFPHSIANAVVREAERRGLIHEERHAQVEYVVAHGIASSIDGVRALIGSYHFIFEDEKCALPEEADRARFDALPDDCSLLYLSLGGELAAVICIEDPIREEAAGVIEDLHGAGFSRIVMMTGDSRKTAAAVAGRLGMDEFFAEVLPEDKAAFIRREHDAGRKVVMIGDGINDSPALSEADAGIAIAAGAAIAREIADITISADDLHELVVLRRISNGLMDRINGNYRRIMTFNGGLIALGLLGRMPSARAALLHNLSTIYFSIDSMKDVLGTAE
ncbi:MAG: heavy metal translocating P-type ATPase [Eubacteriales bacterium]|nr:heavy metal translocating P-type ATPase [Eubacteriales bacterium]